MNTCIASLCPLCGSTMASDSDICDYDKDAESAPTLGDYAAMNSGLLTHDEHVLIVARWAMHRPAGLGQKSLQKFKAVVLEKWGQFQQLYPLSAENKTLTR